MGVQQRLEKGPLGQGEETEQAMSFISNGDCTQQTDKQATDKSSWKLPLFVLNFSLLQLFQMTTNVYYIGIMRTLEKRFGLPSTTTGFVMSINDIIHICLVVFVGYFGRKSHKPIMIGSTALFLVLGSLFMASPYFIFGAENSHLQVLDAANTSRQDGAAQVCHANNTENCESRLVAAEYVDKVMLLFILGAVCNGIGGVAIQVLGMAYVDENAERTKSSLYIGIITSTFALGPIIGIMLAALCTKLPEDLQPTDKLPTDPTWIGAWWLGYVVCSVAVLLAAIPLFFYPKSISDEDHDTKDPKSASLGEQIKEFPAALKKLVLNRAYICYVAMVVFSMYMVIGFFMQLPRYIESHFRQPAFISNIASIVPAVSAVLGGVVGGALMTKLKVTPLGSVKMLFGTTLVTLIGMGVFMFISCPGVSMQGQWVGSEFEMEQPCNSNCSCSTSKSVYSPVCGADGHTYFSPCYAGCQDTVYETGPGGQLITSGYSNCTCVSQDPQQQQPALPPPHEHPEAVPSVCEPNCDTQFHIFIVLTFFICFFSSIGRVPGTIIQFRIVGKNEGSFSLGIMSFAINLLAFIPGPIIFGALIDSTCIIWDQSCGKRGACLLFNMRDFRLLTYGLSFVFILLSFVWLIGLFFSVRTMDRKGMFNTETRVSVKSSDDHTPDKSNQSLEDHMPDKWNEFKLNEVVLNNPDLTETTI